jgi:hypothetical protein
MSNYTAGFNETCHLSPKARALSTVLSAAAGSVIGGITGGHHIAFHTTWVCYFAAFRVVMTGAWFLYEAFHLHRAAGGDQFHDFYKKIPVIGLVVRSARDFDSPLFREGRDPDAGVSFLGWFGWLWVTIYTPVMSTLWLVGNWDKANGALKFARAISVSVSALPITVDTRARYGDVLEKYLGKPFRWLFTIISAVACLYLGLLTLLLLCLAAADWHVPVWTPILVAIAYTLIMLFWTNLSFSDMTPRDEGLPGIRNLGQFLAGLGMGLFGIFFVAQPAGYAVLVSPKSPGVGLKKYAACESVALWRKVIQLLP